MADGIAYKNLQTAVNEVEAGTINNEAWGTKVVSLEDFKKYIER